MPDEARDSARAPRKLIVGRLSCEAFEKDGKRGYRFAGQGSWEPLLPGKLLPTVVVTPAGFAQSWRVELRRTLKVA